MADAGEEDLFVTQNNSITPPCEREDGGMYECLATSHAGSDSVFVTLTVQIPQSITSTYVDEAVAIKGEEVILPCKAIGYPRPQIEWRKDQHETDFSGNSHPESHSSLSSQRHIRTGHLVVSGWTPVDWQPTQLRKSRILFSCKFTITWYKNGGEYNLDEIEDKRVVVLEEGRILQFNNIIAYDTVRFMCVARNLAVPPTIDESTASPANISIIAHQTLTIDCPAQGIPTPEITWFIGDQEISNGHRIGSTFSADGRRLELSNTYVDDSGKRV
ncbi:hypothetical protein CAPTEDRAFT_184960 [Capitella teleta]|uniref:Ig-like domain-containing protein n=1 Tax=Capitella teleta TaxID=283909 RepID=R7UNI0_CAPTE|nr:hypothetical protein CAPTEDRAFT_184960 [Capitella teleta]|eukprot:ELU04956.1 hypothetical protein CAPTEDRAFT_184960 [Capitella teleta]